MPSGEIYEGEWKNGMRHGLGVLVKPNGTRYVGSFFEDKRHGKGEEVLRPSYRYVGDFQNDKKAGIGRLEINGHYFDGQFKNDKPNGRAVSGRLGGAKNYEGEFLDGLKNGSGILYFDDGRQFKGDFKDDLMNGQGTMSWPDGDIYTGNFINDEQTGSGVLINKSSGEKYVGGFLNGLFHGKGERYNRVGTLIESGVWTNGVPTRVISHVEKLKKIDTSSVSVPNTLIQSNPTKSELPVNAQPVIQTQSVLKNEAIVFANRKALIIGNNKYKAISSLKNAVPDAQAIASSLKRYGFDVSLHIDLEEKRFRQVLRDFRYGIQGGDEVVFFYAGHGVEVAGSNFLLPVDVTRIDVTEEKDKDGLRDESIDLKRFMQEIEDRKAKFTLAIIDACREDPFPAKSNSRNVAKKVGLAPTSPATGQMIIFSAGAGQLAIDSLGANDSDKNGLFTRVFLVEINKPAVPVDRVLKNVRTEVSRIARAHGSVQVPAIYDQSEGDFFIRVR